MTFIKRLLAGAMLVVPVTIVGCRHKAEPQPQPTTSAAAPAPTPEPEPVTVSRVDEPTAAPTVNSAAEIAARARAVLAMPVYFAYDRAELDAEAQTKLDEKITVLMADRALRIRIEGHTDERGADEYNLALGQRRAVAVQRYLTQRQISRDRIDIVTLGEERPTCMDAGESCWRANRRAEFVVIAP
jgi:peptidoglycan-associated lipoprotein